MDGMGCIESSQTEIPDMNNQVPSWGYFNEADPKWAAKEIDLAADNGITCFIYDWYWYANTGQYAIGA
jgi:hypothetical protein